MDKKINIKFCPSGFLIYYQLGVADYLFENFDLKNIDFYGGSSGSLVSLILALNMSPKYILNNHIPNILNKINKYWLGNFYITEFVKEELNMILKDKELNLNNKLNISITKLPFLKNKIVNNFENKEELIDCIVGSCTIPFLFSKYPKKYKNNLIVDTCFSNIFSYKDEKTIIIGPNRYSFQESDIYPPDNYPFYNYFLVPSITQANDMFERGTKDALNLHLFFLEKGLKEKKLIN